MLKNVFNIETALPLIPYLKFSIKPNIKYMQNAINSRIQPPYIIFEATNSPIFLTFLFFESNVSDGSPAKIPTTINTVNTLPVTSRMLGK